MSYRSLLPYEPPAGAKGLKLQPTNRVVVSRTLLLEFKSDIFLILCQRCLPAPWALSDLERGGLGTRLVLCKLEPSLKTQHWIACSSLFFGVV